MLEDRPINARRERLPDRCRPRSTTWLAMVLVEHRLKTTHHLAELALSSLVLPPRRASVPKLIWLDDTCSAQLS